MQRLVDTCLFTLSFWLAYQLRTSDWLLGDFGLVFLGLFGGTKEIEPFADFYPFLILTVPLSLVLLESQGFYRRPVLVSRTVTAWQLVKACALTTMGLILVAFLLKTSLARAVFILFGLTSFLSVFLKEELLREELLREDPLRQDLLGEELLWEELLWEELVKE